MDNVRPCVKLNCKSIILDIKNFAHWTYNSWADQYIWAAYLPFLWVSALINPISVELHVWALPPNLKQVTKHFPSCHCLQLNNWTNCFMEGWDSFAFGCYQLCISYPLNFPWCIYHCTHHFLSLTSDTIVYLNIQLAILYLNFAVHSWNFLKDCKGSVSAVLATSTSFQ